ncbi:hypothetical protein Tco_0753754 [Tanacetum coccineum]
MDSQFQSLKEEMHEMRKNYNNHEGDHASKNDDTPMCERHEANYIQSEDYQNQDSHNSFSRQSHYDLNDSEKSLTELNNDVKNDLEDFKRRIRSMRTVHWKLFAKDDGKTTGVLPNKESKTVNQEPQSKSDFEKLMTKFLDDQRKIRDGWSKSQNVSLEQTNRTDHPPPPQAYTDQVNIVFTGSGKSDDHPKIQKDPPPSIIVNNKIKKERPIKTSKGNYYLVKTNKYPFLKNDKVIKEEFEKLEDLNDKGVLLACGTSLEVFNKEFNRMSGMNDDLFTYEVEVVDIPCDSNKDNDSEQRLSHEADDDIGYDPSNVAFTEWLGSKKFNYKMMDHYTKKASWIYWIRGDDEVELTDEEFSDYEDEVDGVFRIDTNIFDFETPILIKNIKMIGSINGTEMYHGLMRNHRPTLEFGLNPHQAYIVGNSLNYQDYEWYEALKDSKLKEQALRNKAIMEGLISDDESRNDGWRRWESHEITYHDHDELEYENETHDERQELCEDHKLPVCNIRRFKMIKYSLGQDE